LAAEAKQCVLMPQETAALLDFDPAYDRYGVTKRRTLSEHIWSAVDPKSGPPHFAIAQVFYRALLAGKRLQRCLSSRFFHPFSAVAERTTTVLQFYITKVSRSRQNENVVGWDLRQRSALSS
jgi:hypothetical protein